MPTSAFFKVNDFIEQVFRGVHDFGNDTFKIGLTNSDPTSSATDFDLLTEITAQFGYPTGGETIPTLTISEVGGTLTIDGGATVFTGSGGSFGPFRYAVIYNSTPSNGTLVAPIVGYYDYGTPVTVNDTETFTVTLPTNIFTVS